MSEAEVAQQILQGQDIPSWVSNVMYALGLLVGTAVVAFGYLKRFMPKAEEAAGGTADHQDMVRLLDAMNRLDSGLRAIGEEQRRTTTELRDLCNTAHGIKDAIEHQSGIIQRVGIGDRRTQG